MIDFLIFGVSLAVLIWGADVLIAQSERIAKYFGLSDFFIGATLIALGTSLPEMAASISANIHAHPEISFSNIIGSNILNITLVLGLVFLISSKIDPDRDFFAKDSSWALFPVFIFVLMIIDGVLSRMDGMLLLILMGAYLLFLIRNGQEIIESETDNNPSKEIRWSQTLIMLLVGFVSVIFGADYMIEGATSLARSFGVSDWVIGVVMIALGTSMPELVVSVAAARKGKSEMAIGNIIGSNMANITVALGAAAAVRPLPLQVSHYLFDISTLVVATLMLVFLSANKLYTKSAGISLLIVCMLFVQHAISNI